MDPEIKMRGAPANEVPKNPYLRKRMQETAQASQAQAKPHNAIEEALQPESTTTPDAHIPSTAPAELDDREPSHKVAIITGASSGIVKAVALHLASNNYNVVLIAREKGPLQEVQQELAKYKVKTLVKECDVTKIIQVHDAVQHTIKIFGRIDVLVNCAGYGIYGELETMRLEDINGQMLTNYFGTVLFIKETLPKLKESKGVIVNVASAAGLTGVPRMAAYSASKHAVVGLSESLRYELEGTGVDVCVVAPGKVKTNFFKHESFKDVDWANDESGIAPGAVARAVDKAIGGRDFLYTVPSSLQLELFLKKLVPDFFVRQRMKEL
jgi:short-subunit dehydrogenase